MSDPIGNLFKMIIGVFESIGMLFTMVLKINEIIACPVKIWNNIGTCLYYWAMDIIIIIIYFIFFYILYIFVFIPVYVMSKVFCFVMDNYIEYACREISYQDVIPSKDSFCFPFEYLYYKATNGRLIYRNGSDINNCYCIPPLKMAFEPYETFSDFEKSENDGKETIVSLLIISLFLLFAVYVTNRSGNTTPIQVAIPM